MTTETTDAKTADRTESAEESLFKLVDSTLMGQVRDELLKRLRTMEKTWAQMGEVEQQYQIESITAFARNLIREMVNLIAGDGTPTLQGLLEKVVFKDGIQATIKISKFETARHSIADAVGGPVRLLVVDAGKYMGEEEEPKADPDQPQLPLDQKAEDEAQTAGATDDEGDDD